MNLFTRLHPAYSAFGMILTLVSFGGWVIVMLVMAPKSSAEFVFTKFINNSGYSSSAWVFILSFYNPVYGLYGTDAMMHLVEEMKDASRDAPVCLAIHIIKLVTDYSVAGHDLVYGLCICLYIHRGSHSAVLLWKLRDLSSVLVSIL